MAAPPKAGAGTVHVPVVPTPQAALEARARPRATDQVAARPDRDPGHRVAGGAVAAVAAIADEGGAKAARAGTVAPAHPAKLIPSPVEFGVGVQVHPALVHAHLAGLVVAGSLVAPSEDAAEEEVARVPLPGGPGRQPQEARVEVRVMEPAVAVATQVQAVGPHGGVDVRLPRVLQRVVPPGVLLGLLPPVRVLEVRAPVGAVGDARNVHHGPPQVPTVQETVPPRLEVPWPVGRHPPPLVRRAGATARAVALRLGAGVARLEQEGERPPLPLPAVVEEGGLAAVGPEAGAATREVAARVAIRVPR